MISITHTHTHTQTSNPIKKPDKFDGVDLLDGTKSVTLICFEKCYLVQ